ncbi:MAG: adenosylcobalamin-dependent ribonucleoside-diphosphate reductase [Phycisphaerales bacterium]|nr:adenosylcobalamin-dependent ribonucleoside-diphosphate reductase [Planctomycetota bacterium]MBL6997439.1 adenosylcobalamin-dependent ribonucleoside-diphosphate reductase [Phycisphaerales bacterium]
MKITRRFTTANENVWESVKWSTRSTKISNADGSVVFEMNNAEIPTEWSQLATDIMVSKYFRKAGVPQCNEDGTPELDENGQAVTGPEHSAKQVIHRLVGCWRSWGESHDYFDTSEDAEAFYDELCWMMLHQICAPNSPQWFNTGLNWAYGISGPAQGHYVADPATGAVTLADDAYSHPQPHACFIQSVQDDLVNEGGIMDLWTREARLFKYGSGTGSNFSSLRGNDESLSGGGNSSGLMSFLKIGDRAAGAIKSGGTTRRAAKMVSLDVDHPDIEEFVSWKVREELKVAALVEGMKHLSPEQKQRAEELNLTLDYDFNGEAYQTVSGQNSNNSVRLSHEFFETVNREGDWDLIRRTDREISRSIPARGLWNTICNAAWHCADPGLQFDTTINDWHTCPKSGRINASNPCSEYMFLDDTACNLASLNLLKFYDSDSRMFDVDSFEHSIRLWTIVLEISVLMAAFPSEAIAHQSWRFRTLGLGFANLGAMLIQAGIPYDSDAGRAVCGAISATLTGRSYAVSAEMASELGPFDGFADNAEDMLRVIRNHRNAACGITRDSGKYEKLRIPPVPINHSLFLDDSINITNAGDLLGRAVQAWDEALDLGGRHGFRNAQVTVIAPTGTIGLLMDCDTTGVEPDFALTKFKKLAGGGYFKIANQSLQPALLALGYSKRKVKKIMQYIMGTLSLDTPLPKSVSENHDEISFRDFLLQNSYTNDDLESIEDSLPTIFNLSFAFAAWAMPEHVLDGFGLTREQATADPSFNGLKLLGLNSDERKELNCRICGTGTIEGAPNLKEEHLEVFDCANRCGEIGTRFIAPEGHIRMMAACQPFITGAISKTINLPNEATTDDISRSYWLSWELGLKANAIYRDGCKLSQPLNAKSDVSVDDEEDSTEISAAHEEIATEVVSAADMASTDNPQIIERVVEKIIERPMRKRLPDTRRSITHHFNVASHEGYLTVGMYDSGGPGELFITMSKEGSTIGGLMDSLGTAISVALQYGVPIESLVSKFAYQRFEPQGITTNRDIPFAKSLVDYIFQWMGMQFIDGYREANLPNRSTTTNLSAEVKTKPTTVKEDTRWSPEDTDTTHPSSTTTSVGGITPTSEPEKEQTEQLDAFTAQRQITIQSTRVSTDMLEAEETIVQQSTTLSQSMASMQGDAPACPECGAITVRSGTCYKCMNCGESLGCS